GVYGTIWIMLIAYITRFMPYGLRYNTTSMLQIHKELEESAAMSGASSTTTFRRVILPLLKPGLIAGWIYIMIVSIRELSSSILLYSPGTEVLSIVIRSEEHTSELQSRFDLVCRLLLEKKKKKVNKIYITKSDC